MKLVSEKPMKKVSPFSKEGKGDLKELEKNESLSNYIYLKKEE
jgi:hypothetical protein